MGRERSVGRRPNLELAGREVAGPGVQVRGGVTRAVPFLAVALRAILEIQGLARLPLRLGADVGTLRFDSDCYRVAQRRREQRSHRHGAQPDDQDSETSAQRHDGGHCASTCSRARTAGLWPVKS